MTPNQKAATFIGWDVTWRIPPEGHRLYGRGGEPMQRREPEPDMSDPRNYLRALESVRARGYVWSMGGDPHLIDTSIYTVAIWGHSEHLVKEAYNKSNCTTLEAAVVSTLAALYDAEHPESADAQPATEQSE